MKNLICFLPLISLLTGCPGGGREGAEHGERRSAFIDGNTICFSVDKKEILSSYSLSANERNYKELLFGDDVNLSYPDTCFKTHFESGVIYSVGYIADDKHYYDTFIFNREKRLIYLGR